MTITNTEAVSDLPSEGEVFRTMHVLLEGIAQIAENHGFERGDDLMVWLAKNLSRRAANSAGGLEVKAPHSDRTRCATEGCGNVATEYFERGGVGSHHCDDCMGKINALSSLAAEAEPVALDANEIWEFLFGEMRGAVPEELTNEILAKLASHINTYFTHPSSPVSAEDWRKAVETFCSPDDASAVTSLAEAFATDRRAGVNSALKSAALNGKV